MPPPCFLLALPASPSLALASLHHWPLANFLPEVGESGLLCRAHCQRYGQWAPADKEGHPRHFGVCQRQVMERAEGSSQTPPPPPIHPWKLELLGPKSGAGVFWAGPHKTLHKRSPRTQRAGTFHGVPSQSSGQGNHDAGRRGWTDSALLLTVHRPPAPAPQPHLPPDAFPTLSTSRVPGLCTRDSDSLLVYFAGYWMNAPLIIPGKRQDLLSHFALCYETGSASPNPLPLPPCFAFADPSLPSHVFARKPTG